MQENNERKSLFYIDLCILRKALESSLGGRTKNGVRAVLRETMNISLFVQTHQGLKKGSYSLRRNKQGMSVTK